MQNQRGTSVTCLMSIGQSSVTRVPLCCSVLLTSEQCYTRASLLLCPETSEQCYTVHSLLLCPIDIRAVLHECLTLLLSTRTSSNSVTRVPLCCSVLLTSEQCYTRASLLLCPRASEQCYTVPLCCSVLDIRAVLHECNTALSIGQRNREARVSLLDVNRTEQQRGTSVTLLDVNY